jgi:hypothetical protein
MEIISIFFEKELKVSQIFLEYKKLRFKLLGNFRNSSILELITIFIFLKQEGKKLVYAK